MNLFIPRRSQLARMRCPSLLSRNTILLIAFSTTILCVTIAKADNLLFDDEASNGLWTNPSNWNPNGTPTASDDAYVGAGLTAKLPESQLADCRDLTLGYSGMTGTLTVGGGTLRAAGSVTVTAGLGTLSLQGDSRIEARSFLNDNEFVWSGPNSRLEVSGGLFQIGAAAEENKLMVTDGRQLILHDAVVVANGPHPSGGFAVLGVGGVGISALEVVGTTELKAGATAVAGDAALLIVRDAGTLTAGRLFVGGPGLFSMVAVGSGGRLLSSDSGAKVNASVGELSGTSGIVGVGGVPGAEPAEQTLWHVTGDLHVGGGPAGDGGHGEIAVKGEARLVVDGELLLYADPGAGSSSSVTLETGGMLMAGAVRPGDGIFEIGDGTLRTALYDGSLHSAAGVVQPLEGGLLTINGSYQQGTEGALRLTLGPGPRGAGYEAVDVLGDLALAGTLEVDTGGWIPQPGQEFKLLTWTGTRTGEFDSYDLPPGQEASWRFRYVETGSGEIWGWFVIPEPAASAWMFVMGGMVLVTAVVRRRKRLPAAGRSVQGRR